MVDLQKLYFLKLSQSVASISQLLNHLFNTLLHMEMEGKNANVSLVKINYSQSSLGM